MKQRYKNTASVNGNLVMKSAFSYDTLNRLTGLDYDNSAGGNIVTAFAWTYDAYVAPRNQLRVDYVFPRYVGWVPGWTDHGVIMVTLKGHRFYLDKSLQGGSDHISFERRSDLIYPDDPRYKAIRKNTGGDARPAIDDPGDPLWNMYYGS